MERWEPIDASGDPDEPRFAGDPAELIDATGLLVALLDRPAWHDDALCREHPDLSWFLQRGEDARPAKAVCNRCLVREECRGYAVAGGVYIAGIWGGTSERERKRLRRPKAA